MMLYENSDFGQERCEDCREWLDYCECDDDLHGEDEDDPDAYDLDISLSD